MNPLIVSPELKKSAERLAYCPSVIDVPVAQKLTLLEKLKLLFIPLDVATDISELGVYTLGYKRMNGKMYIIKERWEDLDKLKQ
jgi:hypothetical protein